jgi:hypothetical protein
MNIEVVAETKEGKVLSFTYSATLNCGGSDLDKNVLPAADMLRSQLKKLLRVFGSVSGNLRPPITLRASESTLQARMISSYVPRTPEPTSALERACKRVHAHMREKQG